MSGLDPDTEADGAGRSADESAGESSGRRRGLFRHRRWPSRHAYDSTSGAEGPSTADEAWQKPRHLRSAGDGCRGLPSAAQRTLGSSSLQTPRSKLRCASTDADEGAGEGLGGNAGETGYQTESEAGEMTGVDAGMEEGLWANNAAAAAVDAPSAAGGWFRRPILWAGIKRGIRRRAVPDLV